MRRRKENQGECKCNERQQQSNLFTLTKFLDDLPLSDWIPVQNRGVGRELAIF